MLNKILINSLREKLRENPKDAVKVLEEDPQILRALLDAESETIKYINMSNQMEQQLRETAQRLKTTQGVVIGVGILFLLMLLDRD